MGLSGRKDKQVIGPDPRNTRWANDTGKLGFKLLSGMGWSQGMGLGKDLDGRSKVNTFFL